MQGAELAIGVMGGIIGALITALVAVMLAYWRASGAEPVNEANPHEGATFASDMSIEFLRLVLREELGKMTETIITAIEKGRPT